MKRLLALAGILLSFSLQAQVENPVPNYVFKNQLGVYRSGLNDTVFAFQIGPNSGGTKGLGLPKVADTTVFTGTKKKGLLIYDVSKDSLAYYNGVRFVYVGSGSGGGSGVTSISAGYGTTFTTITSTGSIVIDTASIATRLRVKKQIDSLAALMASGGLVIADTSFYVTTHLWHKKGIDSIGALKADKATTITAGWGLTGGGDLSANRTLKADTSSTGLATLFNVNNSGKIFPLEHQWKTIYESGAWDNLADFSVEGTMVPTISGSYINLDAATGNYTPRLRILPTRPSDLSRWKMTVKFKIISTTSAFWFGPAWHSIIDHDAGNFGIQAFTNVAGSGVQMFLYSQDGGTQYGTTSGPSRSVNDVLEYTFERVNDSLFTSTLRNITTGSGTTTLSYTYPSNMTVIIPTMGNFALMYNSTSGTIQVQNIRIESSETQAPTLAVLGNSKTSIGYADSWAGRFVNQLKATYPTAVHNAGSTERMADMIKRLPELMQYNAEQWILADIWSNDIGAGTAIDVNIANFKKIYNALSSGGARVYVAAFPEDSTTGGGRSGLTAFKNWLVANYASVYINTWDSLTGGSGNIISSSYYHSSGDRVHTNQAGQNKIYQAIVASGLILTQQANRRAQIRTTSGIRGILQTGDSLSLGIEFKTRWNTLPKSDSLGTSYIPSQIYDDGTNIYVSSRMSPKSFVPNLSLLFNVEGAMGLYGNSGGLYIYDRSDNTKRFVLFDNTDLFRIAYGTTDYWYMNSTGKVRLGNSTGLSGTSLLSALAIKNSFTFSAAQNQAYVFHIDTAKITFTSATTITNGPIAAISPDTLASSGGATTWTHAMSLWIQGPPIAGTNATFTNNWALRISAGNSYMGDKVYMAQIDSGAFTYNVLVQDPSTGQIKKAAYSSGGGSGYASADSAYFVSDKHLKKVIDSLVALSVTIVGAKGIHVNASGAITWIADTSYTYTPDLNNTTNVASSTVGTSFYYRHGAVVEAGYSITIDPTTASSTATVLEIELPPFTADGSEGTLSGHITSGVNEAGIITYAGATAGYARAIFNCTDASSHLYKVTFRYVTTD